MKKFNAYAVYRICCQPGGTSLREILEYVVINMGVIPSIKTMDMIVQIFKYLRDRDLIKFMYLPTDWSRELTKVEIDELENFTGESDE
jgi:hypothetical protein